MITIKNGKQIKENNKFIFREFFAQEKDNVILKILMNYFGAVSEIFPEEWNSKEYILTKTTGYGALIKTLPLYYHKGEEQQDLSKDFFKSLFEKAKKIIINENIELTSVDIGSGEQAQNKLSSLLKKAVE